MLLRSVRCVLATETVCELRHNHHYYMADGVHAETAKPEFLDHAKEESMHADWVAVRIVQLGGRPNFDPEGLNTRSHADSIEGDSLRKMIEEDLVAERIATSTYQEIIRWLDEGDLPPVGSSNRPSSRKSSTPTTCWACSSTSPSPRSLLGCHDSGLEDEVLLWDLMARGGIDTKVPDVSVHWPTSFTSAYPARPPGSVRSHMSQRSSPPVATGDDREVPVFVHR